MKRKLLILLAFFAFFVPKMSDAQTIADSKDKNHINNFDIKDIFEGIYPNPVKDIANLVLNTPNSQILELEIYDLTGSLMFKEDLNTESGKNEFSLNVVDWSSGVYFCRINDGSQVTTKRMVVDK